ncbi:DUF4190 domain-containing protein [Herbiconiux sp. P15]|uniref:DUF4190 domain-containing protein n=1 Tax=Herbiconiux liukaitaii TaxID=3342799 RepID=UPI0035BB9372
MSPPETETRRPNDGAPAQGGTALATTALILGIVTMVLAFVPILNLFAVLLGIVALVIGLIAINRARSRGKGKALTGAILGGLGTLLSIALAVVYTVLGVSALVTAVEQDDVTAVAPASPALPESSAPTASPSTSPAGTLERVVWSSSGTDSAVIDLRGGAGLITFDCEECTGPVALTTDGALETLVDGEGPWYGRYLLDAEGASPTTELSVTATGDWRVIIADPSTATTTTPDVASGEGDDVVFLSAEFDSADISHDGAGVFQVISYGDGSPGSAAAPATPGSAPTTLVDTAGTFYDTVPLTGPAFLQIHADGPWAIVAE